MGVSVHPDLGRQEAASKYPGFGHHEFIEVTSRASGCIYTFGLGQSKGTTSIYHPDIQVSICQRKFNNCACTHNPRLCKITDREPENYAEQKFMIPIGKSCTRVCKGVAGVYNTPPNMGYPLFHQLHEGNLTDEQLDILRWFLSSAEEQVVRNSQGKTVNSQCVKKLPFAYSLTCSLVPKFMRRSTTANCQTLATQFHMDPQSLYKMLGDYAPNDENT